MITRTGTTSIVKVCFRAGTLAELVSTETLYSPGETLGSALNLNGIDCGPFASDTDVSLSTIEIPLGVMALTTNDPLSLAPVWLDIWIDE
jgi:hypothetical protein